MNSQIRELQTLTSGLPATDGAGVKMTRVIGTPELNMLDPFLLLDAFETDQAEDYIGGFPDHPHRGFETVTYLLAGRMRHKDSAGHEGVIEAGGVQWMTAGKGIVHSEMPEQENGLLQGFQLWINLPAREKMQAPAYQDLRRIKSQLNVWIMALKFMSSQARQTRVLVGR
jgi:redox-sensitive bicupin YhaK (pirin superfamily)